MSLHDEIRNAIGAHGLWKSRLASAIETGKSEFTPEAVCTDNQCAFGKWLYGTTITPADKRGAHYETVRKLHTEFHKVTGDVLKMALTGKKDEAQRLVDPHSRYISLSGELIRTMMKWAESSK
jgi:hypothetical protein